MIKYARKLLEMCGEMQAQGLHDGNVEHLSNCDFYYVPSGSVEVSVIIMKINGRLESFLETDGSIIEIKLNVDSKIIKKCPIIIKGFKSKQRVYMNDCLLYNGVNMVSVAQPTSNLLSWLISARFLTGSKGIQLLPPKRIPKDLMKYLSFAIDFDKNRYCIVANHREISSPPIVWGYMNNMSNYASGIIEKWIIK